MTRPCLSFPNRAAVVTRSYPACDQATVLGLWPAIHTICGSRNLVHSVARSATNSRCRSAASSIANCIVTVMKQDGGENSGSIQLGLSCAMAHNAAAAGNLVNRSRSSLAAPFSEARPLIDQLTLNQRVQRVLVRPPTKYLF